MKKLLKLFRRTKPTTAMRPCGARTVSTTTGHLYEVKPYKTPMG